MAIPLGIRTGNWTHPVGLPTANIVARTRSSYVFDISAKGSFAEVEFFPAGTRVEFWFGSATQHTYTGGERVVFDQGMLYVPGAQCATPAAGKRVVARVYFIDSGAVFEVETRNPSNTVLDKVTIRSALTDPSHIRAFCALGELSTLTTIAHSYGERDLASGEGVFHALNSGGFGVGFSDGVGAARFARMSSSASMVERLPVSSANEMRPMGSFAYHSAVSGYGTGAIGKMLGVADGDSFYTEPVVTYGANFFQPLGGYATAKERFILTGVARMSPMNGVSLRAGSGIGRGSLLPVGGYAGQTIKLNMAFLLMPSPYRLMATASLVRPSEMERSVFTGTLPLLSLEAYSTSTLDATLPKLKVVAEGDVDVFATMRGALHHPYTIEASGYVGAVSWLGESLPSGYSLVGFGAGLLIASLPKTSGVSSGIMGILASGEGSLPKATLFASGTVDTYGKAEVGINTVGSISSATGWVSRVELPKSTMIGSGQMSRTGVLVSSLTPVRLLGANGFFESTGRLSATVPTLRIAPVGRLASSLSVVTGFARGSGEVAWLKTYAINLSNGAVSEYMDIPAVLIAGEYAYLRDGIRKVTVDPLVLETGVLMKLHDDDVRNLKRYDDGILFGKIPKETVFRIGTESDSYEYPVSLYHNESARATPGKGIRSIEYAVGFRCLSGDPLEINGIGITPKISKRTF